MNGQQLWDLIEGLEANDLLYYTHLLTGILILVAALTIEAASCSISLLDGYIIFPSFI